MRDTLDKYKVLVIEPDKNILEVLTLTLQEEGFEVFGFDEFSLSVKKLLEEILIDIAVVEFREKGELAVISLKEIKLKYDIPVIALSCDNDIALKYKPHGFNGYISKPFDINELASILYSFV